MSEKKNKRDHEQNNDKKKVKERLKGFDPKSCEAYRFLLDTFKRELKGFELFQLAEYFQKKQPDILKLDREAKRRKVILIKWYQDNFTILKPMLMNIVLQDEDNRLFGVNKDLIAKYKSCDEC